MTTEEVYQRYQIMPLLSLHMRRVAAVGKLILDGWNEPIGKESVMRTLLLHDMGNIVKFDLSPAGQKKLRSAEETDLPYWRTVQEKYWQAYGRDTHTATKKIIEELGFEDVNLAIEAEYTVYFHANPREIMQQPDAAQILLYSDMRAVPSGVVPLKERIDDLSRRYGKPIPEFNYLYEVEEYLQTKTATPLTSITEESVAPLIPTLLQYPL